MTLESEYDVAPAARVATFVNGPLALVAQDKLFAAILDFYKCADNRQCRKGSLGAYSRNVARACRTSLEESWKVSLPPVPTSDALP